MLFTFFMKLKRGTITLRLLNAFTTSKRFPENIRLLLFEDYRRETTQLQWEAMTKRGKTKFQINLRHQQVQIPYKNIHLLAMDMFFCISLPLSGFYISGKI